MSVYLFILLSVSICITFTCTWSKYAILWLQIDRVAFDVVFETSAAVQSLIVLIIWFMVIVTSAIIRQISSHPSLTIIPHPLQSQTLHPIFRQTVIRARSNVALPTRYITETNNTQVYLWVPPWIRIISNIDGLVSKYVSFTHD